ncbi:MAG: class I SAM-dependent methyltransferase [Bryobacteraceae bacterium]
MPEWTGCGFQLGTSLVPVLAYSVGNSGWTDDLTTFSEETGGENHYMDVASRANALQALATFVTVERPVLMDIGCSSGFMLKALRQRFPAATVLGSDYVKGPLVSLARSHPDIPLLQFDLTQCPLPGECVDGITLLNVIEHIDDDAAALRQTFRLLRPGGVAVIEAPAGPGLYDVYDKHLMHFRRYRMRELLSTVKSAGFQILHRSHLGFFIYPAFALVKKRNRRYLRAEPDVQRRVVASSIQTVKDNSLMHAVMRVENAMRRFVSYPAGVRCFVICRKPAGSAV